MADNGPNRSVVDGSKSYKVSGGDLVEIFDLDFAAYCLMRDLPVADMIADRSSSNGHQGRRRRPAMFKFVFQDTGGEVARLAIDYTNSESAKHADCVRRLKKAVRSASLEGS